MHKLIQKVFETVFDLHNIKLSSLVASFCHTKGSSKENRVIPLSESHGKVDTGNLLWTALSPFFVLIQCAISTVMLYFCIIIVPREENKSVPLSKPPVDEISSLIMPPVDDAVLSGKL